MPLKKPIDLNQVLICLKQYIKHIPFIIMLKDILLCMLAIIIISTWVEGQKCQCQCPALKNSYGLNKKGSSFFQSRSRKSHSSSKSKKTKKIVKRYRKVIKAAQTLKKEMENLKLAQKGQKSVSVGHRTIGEFRNLNLSSNTYYVFSSRPSELWAMCTMCFESRSTSHWRNSTSRRHN